MRTFYQQPTLVGCKCFRSQAFKCSRWMEAWLRTGVTVTPVGCLHSEVEEWFLTTAASFDVAWSQDEVLLKINRKHVDASSLLLLLAFVCLFVCFVCFNLINIRNWWDFSILHKLYGWLSTNVLFYSHCTLIIKIKLIASKPRSKSNLS